VDATACPHQRVADLDRLRRVVAEAASFGGDDETFVTLGISLIDDILGGGLCCSMLHEVAAMDESQMPAATGFVLALAVRRSAPHGCIRRAPRSEQHDGEAFSALPSSKAVLWIAEDLSLAENGMPYGPGLDEIGIVPERLIRVAAPRGRDVLWVMEEAMRCRAVGVVIGELRASRIDQVTTRRLSLAAAAGNILGLILRTAPDKTPSAAATRWIIGAVSPRSSPARNERWAIGPPRLAAHLMRNRRGQLGTWMVEWNRVEQRFEVATHSESMAGAAFDRPHRAAVA
jgi:protein ImuA